jgi:NSS family neurotransmitter:Na+ symporter
MNLLEKNMNQAKKREHFGSKIGFLLASIGSAIGLGLLWKFPYVIGQNGGGLFLLAYFFCLFFAGIPLYIGEVILGRSTQSAAIMAFKEGSSYKNSKLVAGGYLGVLSSFLIMTYYSVIAGWGLSYILTSLSGFYSGKSISQVGMIFDKLSQSGSITILWHGVFTAITMGIVLAGVKKGIEYWSKILVKCLLVMLVGLFFYSTTLPGFAQAANFIFIPKKGAFTFLSFLEALGLAFMTLSLGQGIMISYGSYVEKGVDLVKMSFIVAISVMIVAILASLIIFPAVFTFGFAPDSGPGLVFKTLPILFAKLPGSMVISTIFFSLFVFTALTSAVPLVEVVATNLMEKLSWSRQKATTLVCLATFICGIPSALSWGSGNLTGWTEIFGHNFQDTVDNLATVWLIPLAGLFTALFMGYRMDKSVLKKEFYDGAVSKWGFSLWFIGISVVVPIVILLIILQTSGLINFSNLF